MAARRHPSDAAYTGLRYMENTMAVTGLVKRFSSVSHRDRRERFGQGRWHQMVLPGFVNVEVTRDCWANSDGTTTAVMANAKKRINRFLMVFSGYG